MKYFIFPRKLQIFCNVFSSILYTADLSTGLLEIANLSRSVSFAPSVSPERTEGSSKIGQLEGRTTSYYNMELESSLARRDNPEMFGKW